MNSSGLYFRLLHYVLPYWRLFFLAIVAMVISAVSEVLLPTQLQPLLDGGFVNKDPDIIKTIPLILTGLFLLKGTAMLISSVIIAWIASRVVMDLRSQMFAKILSLPTFAFDNTSSGVLLSKITYDVNRVMAASTEVLIVIVRDGITVLGLLIWMFYLNWLLSSLIFIVMPLIILTVRLVSRRLRGINWQMQTTMGQLTRILEESINGHKLVKIFAGQHYEQQRFDTTSNQIRQLEVKTQLTSGLSILIVQMLTVLVLAIIIYIAAQQAAEASLTVGGFVSLFTAMGMLFAPSKRLTKINDQLQQGLAAAQSIFQLIDQRSETDLGTQSTTHLQGNIIFNNVNFCYPDKNDKALQQINLTITAGETVAFVGPSGSGKTTLVNLIPRFYPLSQGTLLLDGIDSQTLSLTTLRNNIALVSQDIVLFNDTIAANIAYGHLANTPHHKIVAAAQAAQALTFIEQMPEGFNTLIGERGVKLSGGQRQRLAIARALLKDAPILIFDEATSALDTQAESLVQQALERLKQNRTVLIIAHRLSTIAQADRIVVMERGKIVEIGTHSQLLAKSDVYANLYQVQQ